MANKKISDFTAATSVAASDLFEIETVGGNSRKLSANLVGVKRHHQHFLDFASAGTSFAAGFMALIPYLVRSDCVIDAVEVFATAASGSTILEPCIYAGSVTTMKPAGRLAFGSAVTGLAYGVNSLPLTATLSLTAGTYVWFGIGTTGAAWTPCKCFGHGGATFAYATPPPATASSTFNTGPGDASQFYGMWMKAL